jgi:hypothetical protein
VDVGHSEIESTRHGRRNSLAHPTATCLAIIRVIAAGPGLAALPTKLASLTSRTILDVNMSAMRVLRPGGHNLLRKSPLRNRQLRYRTAAGLHGLLGLDVSIA